MREKKELFSSSCLILESYHISGFESCIEFMILLIVMEERKICTCTCSYFLHINTADCFFYLRQMNKSPRRDFPPKVEQQKTESVTGEISVLLTVREGRTGIS